jgi:hypothetical protein
MSRLFFHATRSDVSADEIPDWSIKLVACIAIVIVTVLCAAASNLGTRAAVLFTAVKACFSTYCSLIHRRFALAQVAALVCLPAKSLSS